MIKKILIVIFQGIFIILITSNQAYSQKSCNTEFENLKAAKARHESQGSSFAYQSYLAAQNTFQHCLDTGGQLGQQLPPPSRPNSGNGTTGNNTSNPLVRTPTDSDNDGVEDISDVCPDTQSGMRVDERGCPLVMNLVLFEDQDFYSFGEKVIIKGLVKDTRGDAIPGVLLSIKIEGTSLSTTAGTMQDIPYFSGQIQLPENFSDGVYSVKVTASKNNYPDVSKTKNILISKTKKSDVTVTPLPKGQIADFVGHAGDAYDKPVTGGEIDNTVFAWDPSDVQVFGSTLANINYQLNSGRLTPEQRADLIEDRNDLAPLYHQALIDEATFEQMMIWTDYASDLSLVATDKLLTYHPMIGPFWTSGKMILNFSKGKLLDGFLNMSTLTKPSRIITPSFGLYSQLAQDYFFVVKTVMPDYHGQKPDIVGGAYGNWGASSIPGEQGPTWGGEQR